MKKQFKLAVERNVEFSILKRKKIIENPLDGERKVNWEEDLYETRKQISEIAKNLPSAPGLLIFSKKSNEILKVVFSKESIRERFLNLKSNGQFESFIQLMKEENIKTVKINYAREIRA